MSEGIYKQKLPRRLVNSGRIKKIAFGEGYGIGLTSGSQLLAWGKEYPGAGSKSDSDLRTPKLIDTDFDIVDVASGGVHCGVVDSMVSLKYPY